MTKIDREKVIEGLEAMREFFGFSLPSQANIFEAYQNILTDAIVLLKEQEAKTVLNAGRQAIGNNKVFYGNCPNCQRRLYAKTSNYCQYCGKKVKWE